MNYVLSILISTMILVTINTVATLFQQWSVEKERVKAGYPAFNNFDYYYPLLNWLLGFMFLLVISFFSDNFIQPTNIWFLILYCVIFIIGYLIVGLITTLIMSFIQAKLIKKK